MATSVDTATIDVQAILNLSPDLSDEDFFPVDAAQTPGKDSPISKYILKNRDKFPELKDNKLSMAALRAHLIKRLNTDKDFRAAVTAKAVEIVEKHDDGETDAMNAAKAYMNFLYFYGPKDKKNALELSGKTDDDANNAAAQLKAASDDDLIALIADRAPAEEPKPAPVTDGGKPKETAAQDGLITQEAYDAVRKETFGGDAEILQSILTLSGKAYDPRWTDNKHQERTNAAMGIFLRDNGDDLGIPADLRAKFPVNNAKGLMDKPVDPAAAKAMNDFLLMQAVNGDVQYRMQLRGTAIEILEKEEAIGSKRDAHDQDDLWAVRVFNELLGVKGNVLEKTDDKIKALQAQQDADQKIWDEDPRNPDKQNRDLKSEADEARRAQREAEGKLNRAPVDDGKQATIDDLRRQLDAERNENKQLRDELKQDTDIINQFRRASGVDRIWMNSLKDSGFFKDDQKARDAGCVYVDSLKGLSREEQMRGVIHVGSLTVGKDGRLHAVDDGHVILVRANEQGVALAYDITKHINDKKLAGIDTVPVDNATLREAAADMNAAREDARANHKSYVEADGFLKDMKGDVKHGFDKDYKLHGFINADGHPEARIAPNRVIEAEGKRGDSVYGRAEKQTPDVIYDKTTMIDNVDSFYSDKKVDGHKFNVKETKELGHIAEQFDYNANNADEAWRMRHMAPTFDQKLLNPGAAGVVSPTTDMDPLKNLAVRGGDGASARSINPDASVNTGSGTWKHFSQYHSTAEAILGLRSILGLPAKDEIDQTMKDALKSLGAAPDVSDETKAKVSDALRYFKENDPGLLKDLTGGSDLKREGYAPAGPKIPPANFV